MPATAHRCPEPAEIAAELIQELGSSADAVAYLEDRLAGCDDEREAGTLCDLIDAAAAMSRNRLH